MKSTAPVILMLIAACSQDPQPCHPLLPYPHPDRELPMNIGVSNAVGFTPPEVGDLLWTSPALVPTGSGIPVISTVADMATALFSPAGNQSPLTPVGVLTFAPTRTPNLRAGVAVDRDVTYVKSFFTTGAIVPGAVAMAVYNPLTDRFITTPPNETQWDQLPSNTVAVELGTYRETIVGDEDDDYVGLAAAYIDVSKIGLIYRRAISPAPAEESAFTGRTATESAPGTVVYLTRDSADAPPQGIGVFVQTPLADGIGAMLVPARGSFVAARGIATLDPNLPTNTPIGLNASALLAELSSTGSSYAQVGPWGSRSGVAGLNVSAVIWEPQVVLVTTP